MRISYFSWDLQTSSLGVCIFVVGIVAETALLLFFTTDDAIVGRGRPNM